FREQDGIAGILNRLDHRDDDSECAGIASFEDVADVCRRNSEKRDTPRFGDHLNQLLRFAPGQGTVLHFNPHEILPDAGFFRVFEIGIEDRVAKDLLAGFEFRDDGVEGKRTGRRYRLLLLLGELTLNWLLWLIPMSFSHDRSSTMSIPVAVQVT